MPSHEGLAGDLFAVIFTSVKIAGNVVLFDVYKAFDKSFCLDNGGALPYNYYILSTKENNI